MADVELVVRIPEEMYEWVNDVNKFSYDYGISDFIDLIKNGTPLPKGHGRIGDLDEAVNNIEHFIDKEKLAVESRYDLGLEFALHRVEKVSTIIEADKVESAE